MEVKSSSIKGNKTDKTSTNSGQRPIRPKTNTQSTASMHSSLNKPSAHKPIPRSQTAQAQQTASSKELTPTGNTVVKNRSPPSLEKPGKPQKRLNLEIQTMEADLQTENSELVQENPIITRSNEMEPVTRQHEDSSTTNASDATSSNRTPTSCN